MNKSRQWPKKPVEIADLWMPRGDSRILQLTVLKDEKPVPITGCKLVFTAVCGSPAASLHGTTDDGSVIITNGPGGVAIFPIQPALTSGFPNIRIPMTFTWVLTDLTDVVTTVETGRLTIAPNL